MNNKLQDLGVGPIEHRILVLAARNGGWFETSLMRYLEDDPVQWSRRKEILDSMVESGLFTLQHDRGKRYRYIMTQAGLEIAGRLS